MLNIFCIIKVLTCINEYNIIMLGNINNKKLCILCELYLIFLQL